MFLISEGSCDFEDWSNNAEYSVYFKIYSDRKPFLFIFSISFIQFYFYSFYSFFYQINAESN